MTIEDRERMLLESHGDISRSAQQLSITGTMAVMSLSETALRDNPDHRLAILDILGQWRAALEFHKDTVEQCKVLHEALSNGRKIDGRQSL